MMPSKRPTEPPRDADAIRDISEAVYRIKLGPDQLASMLAKDGDGGAKLRARAAGYDSTTVAYLTALGLPIPRRAEAEQITEGLFGD